MLHEATFAHHKSTRKQVRTSTHVEKQQGDAADTQALTPNNKDRVVTAAASMNNSIDSAEGNIQPDPRGRGAGARDGNQWNYALLVPMLGLAVFGSIWTKKSQEDIQKVKDQYELELTKERQRVIMSRQEGEKSAGAVLQKALERENNWYRRATATLKELEGLLVDRQNIYCSYIQPRDQRLEMERNMLHKVAEMPNEARLDLKSDLKDIFKRDKHCADLLNVDKRKNGSLMWVYLKYWQVQITIQKHKKALESISGGKTQSDRK